MQHTAPVTNHSPTLALPRMRGRLAALIGATATPRIALLLALVAALILGLVQLVPPRVVPATAPASEFSAERAMAGLRVIAAQPRPTGSPGNAAVRQYLLDILATMGLHPEVQVATGITRFPGSDTWLAGTVHNVVVRLPGTASTGAIALDAHYDGAATGPGASDNGAAVATVLETLRAIRAGPPLDNDVIAVFADAEENGDVGAAAFMAEHPWAKDVRLALVFEAMGNGGLVVPYAASKEDGWLVRETLRTVPHPSGSSLLTTLMGLESGGGMDLEEYMSRGVPGIGVAYTDLQTSAYHTARDSLATIDPRSVQDQGAWSLSFTRHFGQLDLANIPRERDATFFPLPGVMVRYTQALALPFAALVGVLFVAMLTFGFRRRQLTMRGFLLGAVLFPLGVLAATLLTTLVWWIIKHANPAYRLPMVGSYQPLVYLLAFVALTTAGMTALLLVLLRRTRPADIAVGALVTWAALMALTAYALPAVAFLFTWPLLAAMVGPGWAFLTGDDTARRGRYVAVLALAALPGIALTITPGIMPTITLMYRFEMAGLPLAPLPMFFVALLIGLLVPQLAFFTGDTGRRVTPHRARWLIPGGCALIALLLIAGANLRSGLNAGHPRPDSVAYLLDADTGQARWASTDAEPDSYTAQFIPADATRQRGWWPSSVFGAPPLRTAPAPAVPLAAPTVTVLADTVTGDSRQVRLRLASPRGAPYLGVRIAAAGEITAATLDGRPIDLGALTPAQRATLLFTYIDVPPLGVEVGLTVAAPAPITVALEDVSGGLPAIPSTAVAPRSAAQMPAMNPALPDPTFVRRTVTIGLPADTSGLRSLLLTANV